MQASRPAGTNTDCTPSYPLSLYYEHVQAANLSQQAQQETGILADFPHSWSSFDTTGFLCASSAGLLPGLHPFTPPLAAAMQPASPVSGYYPSALQGHNEIVLLQHLREEATLPQTLPEAFMSAPSPVLGCSMLEQQATGLVAMPQPLQTDTVACHSRLEPHHKRGAVLADSPAADMAQFLNWADQWLPELPGDDVCCRAGQPQHAIGGLLLSSDAPGHY